MAQFEFITGSGIGPPYRAGGVIELDERLEKYLSGEKLYGDDFDEEQIEEGLPLILSTQWSLSLVV